MNYDDNNRRFKVAKQGFRERWYSLPEPTRKYITIGLVVVVAVLIAAVATYMTPGVYPSGEGG